jgi:hypothetical protein
MTISQSLRDELKRTIMDIMVFARHNGDSTYGTVADEILDAILPAVGESSTMRKRSAVIKHKVNRKPISQRCKK